MAYPTTYRKTPNKFGKSSAEIIHGRQLQILLSLFNPSAISEDNESAYCLTVKYFGINHKVYFKNFWVGESVLHGTIFKHPVNIMYIMKFANMLIKMQKKN